MEKMVMQQIKNMVGDKWNYKIIITMYSQNNTFVYLKNDKEISF